MKVSHAEIKDPDGNVLKVHKVCKENALAGFKKITAAPDDYKGPR